MPCTLLACLRNKRRTSGAVPGSVLMEVPGGERPALQAERSTSASWDKLHDRISDCNPGVAGFPTESRFLSCSFECGIC